MLSSLMYKTQTLHMLLKNKKMTIKYILNRLMHKVHDFKKIIIKIN